MTTTAQARRAGWLPTVIALAVACVACATHSPPPPTSPAGDRDADAPALTPPGPVEPPTAVPPTAAGCDETLWAHVYHPARLTVVTRCAKVTGVITSVRAEPDGDDHIRLRPDPAYLNLLTAANVADQHGDLVLEPVCVGVVSQTDAAAACAGYRSAIRIPPVGSHVTVTGAYVLDTGHDGWAELHPITSLEVSP